MQEYERVIDLKLFAIDVLRQWRKLLVFMGIGAILGAGFGYYGVLHPKTELVMTQEEIAAAESTIAQNESTIASYQAELPNQKANLATYEENKKNYEALLEQTSSVEVIDSALIAEIAEINQNIVSLNSQINTTQQRIQTLESEIPRLQESNQTLLSKTEETVKVQENNVALYLVAGAILFVIIYVVWRFLLLIIDNKIRTTDEIYECYQIPMLGSVYGRFTAEELKQHKGLDAFLDRFEEKFLDEENLYEMIAAKLELYAKDYKHVLITGTINVEEQYNVWNKIKRYIRSDVIEVMVGENPLESTETVWKMKGKAMVLVEKVGVSERKKIESVLAVAKESNTNIIGAIIL